MDTCPLHQDSNRGNESPMSVRDARRRFEQLSTSNSSLSSPTKTTPTHRGSTPAAVPARPPRPQRPPLKKAITSPGDFSTSAAVGGKNVDSITNKGQRSQGQSCDASRSVVKTASQEVSSTNNGGKTKFKGKSLKQAFKRGISSVASSSGGDKAASGEPSSVVGGTGASAENSDRKLSSTKKLFKRKSMEKNKVDGVAEHASSNGSRNTNTDSKGGKGEEASLCPTSDHKKVSPLPRERLKATEPSSPTRSKPSSPTTSSSSSSPIARPGGVPFKRSFSDKVLVSPNQESAVHTTLRREGEERGSGREKIIGGSRPTSPRVIEDKELKLDLSEGKNQVYR